MAPHENVADSPTISGETSVLGARSEEENVVKAGEKIMFNRSVSDNDPVVVKTISSMGRPGVSLADLAEDGENDEHDLVPVQEYYCSPTTTLPSSSPDMKSLTPTTAATSAASSISSSFSSTSLRLLKTSSSSSFSFGGGGDEQQQQQQSSDKQLEQQQHQPLHLQNYTQQQQDQLTRRRISLSPRSSSSSKAQNWEERLQPVLIKYLNDEQLAHFSKLYHDHGMSISLQLLESLAYLASSPSFQEESYWDRLYTLALFWSSKRKSRSLKLSCLKTLMQCLSPPVAGWQHCDPVIEGTLDFLLTPNMEWEYMDNHTEMNLLIELRGLSLCFYQKEQARIAKVVRTGDTAAVLISASAKLMEEGMIQSGQIIEGHLDKACAKFKSWVKPGQYPLIVDQNAIVAKAFASAAKRASEDVKDSTIWLVQNARDASSKGLEMVVEKLDETGHHRSVLQEQLSPESAEALKAVGKVGMATLGATALVGEAMVETSRALFLKTGSVAADIVEHKYGTDAGKVVLDASETADNLVRAASNVTLLERKVLAKTMAKSAGKDKIEEEILRAKDSLHLLEIQMAGMIHQALGNGPAASGGGMPHHKLLEGIKVLKQAQLVQPRTPSPTTATSSSSALKRMPTTSTAQMKTLSKSQQAVTHRV
mmetsp:Transcript_27867/g.67794  ORF Transcript_27867/g.67794 Transcript_27867/m.67794 type:complete len:651 (-) Transcript_27867:151-2103(-)|eukprot:CAMPEP_0113620076 /NCGR_PEP_ID=MMETSP0017_2-20120614/10215_1 /TAXON_ID=2856 /ORGANISM="Cylindrotheca closterium" /LENGTH=650 /DNA_ID=CAMNT_0000529703 /DNA_START=67 /DNA_END=2019 /DNA_ORIENTATION=- /assembly_acc=CAM_ASM_000147